MPPKPVPSSSARDATAAMIEAFITDPDEQKRWLYMLRNCREAHGCPCTTTTPDVLSLGLAAGRPVSNCGLCYGTGVASEAWSHA